MQERTATAAPPVEVLPPLGPMGAMPAGTAAMQVRGSYVTAVQVQKKRELGDVQRRLLEEANLMGEAAYYGWGAGEDRIEGPSEAIAFAAARCWGNTAIEYSPVEETDDSYVFTAHFVDLETGFTLSRPFRQSKKWTVYGKMDAVRKEDVRFQIGATKAARNVILKALPAWLIDKAMETAKAGVRARIEKFIAEKGQTAAQDLILSELAKVGVKEESILRKFGVADRKALDVEKLVILRGDLKAIQTGQERPAVLFPAESAEGANGRGSLRPEDLKPAGDSAPPEPPPPAPADAPPPPPPGLDDGPEIISSDKAAALRSQAERAGLDGDQLAAEICGTGLSGMPASFETTFLREVERRGKKARR